jgi:virginiamycin A acetyltransferase
MKKTLLKYTRKVLIFLFTELSKMRNENYDFQSILSYSTNVKTGKNVKIDPTYRLNDVVIGDGTYITLNSRISKTEIGKFGNIGPNILCGWGIHPTNGIASSAIFYSTNLAYGYTLSKSNKVKEERKLIKIGNDVFIGANVTILDGVTIGDGAIIGAGAVVSKNIPPYAIAVGSPIRVIKYRFEDKQIEKLLKIKWWDFNEEQLKDVEQMFFEVDAFIKKYDV